MTPTPAQHTITVLRGDGIGPEIMEATLSRARFDAARPRLGVRRSRHDGAGIAGRAAPGRDDGFDPQEPHRAQEPAHHAGRRGFSSINVELRKRFDLYANVRPAKSFPNTKSRFPTGVDLITVRENTEGAYIGEGQCCRRTARPPC
jgi:isocitrate dehydrogenase (NAD+)